MASSLQKLLKRSSLSPIFLTPTRNPNPQIPINPNPQIPINPNSQIPISPIFFTQSDFTEPKHGVLHPLLKLSPFLSGSTTTDETLTTHFTKSVFYPNSPFGLLLDPICSTGSIQLEPDDEAEIGIWADSVKKKRKKKMNKHKYQKLRKRLRRQT